MVFIMSIDTYDHRETRAITGFSRLVYNRVGVKRGAQCLMFSV